MIAGSNIVSVALKLPYSECGKHTLLHKENFYYLCSPHSARMQPLAEPICTSTLYHAALIQ